MRRTTALATLVAMLASLVLLGAAPPQHAGAEFTRVIVSFDDGVLPAQAAPALARRFGGEVVRVYEHALNGASLDLPEEAIAGLSRARSVVAVERDQPMFPVDAEKDLTTQTNPTWGLDRIDGRERALDSSYRYPASAGSGVIIYIVDSGVIGSHEEFIGRTVPGYSAVTAADAQDPWQDCSGHGTHVAGTAAGTEYGVAKLASISSVRVFNCAGSGTSTDLIAGIDWIIGQQGDTSLPAVANLSLGFMGIVEAVDTAIENLVAAGVHVAVAAGNGNRGGRAQDACNYSPARVTPALTVSATNSTDARPTWANYGTCIDVFAPGVAITSAWRTSDTATNTISGTSMASPHVAGVAALLLAEAQDASTDDIHRAITEGATSGVIPNPGSGSPNRLVYSLTPPPEGDAGSDPDPQDPDPQVPDPDPEDPGPEPEDPEPVGIDLAANAYKVRGLQKVDLSWSGAVSTEVDVFRNGDPLGTVGDTGSFTDNIDQRGGGSYTYQVCESNTTTCSGEVTAGF